MGLMHKALSAVLILAVVLGASPASKHPAKPAAKLATPPPTITTVTSRPFCSALRNNIGPAIGTLLQNDNIIRQGPKLLSDYNKAIGNGENGTARAWHSPTRASASRRRSKIRPSSTTRRARPTRSVC